MVTVNLFAGEFAQLQEFPESFSKNCCAGHHLTPISKNCIHKFIHPTHFNSRFVSPNKLKRVAPFFFAPKRSSGRESPR